MTPPALQRERDVGQRHVRVHRQIVRQARPHPPERGRGPRGEHQQLRPRRRVRHGARGRLLQHHVGVRAAHAQGRDAGATRFNAARPRRASGVDEERSAFERDVRVGRLEIQARR